MDLDPTYIELYTRYVRKDNFDGCDYFALTTVAIRGHQSLSAQTRTQTAPFLSLLRDSVSNKSIWVTAAISVCTLGITNQ